jgi:hypothetical protein
VQVRHAHHGAQLLEHEEDRAVVDEAAPVAPADEVALSSVRPAASKLASGSREERLAVRGLDHAMQVIVDAVARARCARA